MTIPDAASLHLTTGMTLEAWVNPSTVTSALAGLDLQGQRQLLAGGDLEERRRAGCRATLGSSDVDTLGTAVLGERTPGRS